MSGTCIPDMIPDMYTMFIRHVYQTCAIQTETFKFTITVSTHNDESFKHQTLKTHK